MTRRTFMPAAAALSIVPRQVLGGAQTPPSDRLNIAAVGIGGMGANYVAGCDSEHIAALCDVDSALAAKMFAKYPQAKRYRDFREMLDREKDLDGVIIGTPDHSHAVVALAAMKLGKAVYCAKPMTRTVAEARELARVAREKKLATQMSVQSSAGEAARSTEELVQSGAIGAVREAHVWSDRPVWPQGLNRPEPGAPVPAALSWDLWLGPAPERPYNPVYHPFNWRGWYDFGTGALGDMACHAFHVVFNALKLKHAAGVQASTNFQYDPALEHEADMTWMRARKRKLAETFPHASVVTWDFPARGSLPPARLHWYDGGLKPPRPAGMDTSRQWPGTGMMFVGDAGVLVTGFSGGRHLLLPEDRFRSFTAPEKTLPRTAGHYKEWIAAAKGGPEATCAFEFGSLITETALLGVIAQRTGKYLAWDAAGMTFTNDAAANELLRPVYREGWVPA